jgi:hypothetical protein
VLKKLVILVGIVALALAIAVSHLWTRLGSAAAIARAETEARMLAEQRDSILTIVARNDSLQRELSTIRVSMEAEANQLRDRIVSLEAARVQDQLTVRSLRRTEDLQARLQTTFPEMAASRWGITEVFDEEGLGIEYLAVPLWFAETFLIDHQNSQAYAMQVDTLRALSGVQDEIIALQDSVFTLERQSRNAYQTGYDNAFQLYQNLNREHVALLRQPRFNLGLPGGLTALAGSFGAGLLFGIVAK